VTQCVSRVCRLRLLWATCSLMLPASTTLAQPRTVDRDATASQGVWYACGQANTYPGKLYVYSGPMATYSAWHRPMAFYAPVANKTFFVFGNPKNAPAISYYDHARRTFAAPVVLGSNPDGDAHRNPTLAVDEQGYLYVFHGAHGHPTHVVNSVVPYEIGRWERKTDLDQRKTTYPQPWQLQPGQLFVSFREPSGQSFRVSTDGATSWQPPVSLIQFAGSAIYAMTIAESGPYPRKVHIVWSRLGGGTPEEIRTKHLWARRYNVYYACSEDGGSTWKRSDGTDYKLPISEQAAEKLYDSGERGVWLKDVQVDPDRNPCVVWLDSECFTYAASWKFARHAAGAWRIGAVTTSDHMYDDGALVVLARNDFRIYGPTTAVQPHEDGGEIEEWKSTDQGSTWTNTHHVTSGSRFSHDCVKTVFNAARGDFRILWSYGDSEFPPATRDVFVYYYGEIQPAALRVAFPVK